MTKYQPKPPPSPEKLASANTEGAHQTALMAQVALHLKEMPELIMLYAIPNGDERNSIVASKLKGQGVKAGVPDLFLPVARGGKHGLYIEMKLAKYRNRKNGGCSEQQLRWHKMLKEQGYGVAMGYTWQEAFDIIVMYYNS